ncbi:hypothetical protein FisN_7Hh158 [Fistulifera solaris]|uniref:Uncharacterized protein n=1 Tax=Fistulifera solaris TaxID=1519565 RepID=A0A1Z5K3L3_FISSO|nr:hypothetical protein FisN_7Hh158 [Fistulifera solaris]|eukprot:GAX20843.1 hypothetical protein FisN_7Hh158 [Fistulifera solaris]
MNVLGLLDLMDDATLHALHHSINQNQIHASNERDLVQTLLLRHLLANNTAVDQLHVPWQNTLLNTAPTSNLLAPSDLTLPNLLNSNSQANIAAQHLLNTRQTLPLENPLSSTALPNELLRYILAGQNNSLRELSLRFNGIPEAPSAPTSFLSLATASQVLTGDTGDGLRSPPPFSKTVTSPAIPPASLPDKKPSPKQSDRNLPKTCREGDSIVPVFSEDEKYVLSEYQSYLRQQIVYVETERARKGGKVQGRNKPITARQVGVMCVHCAKVPYDARPRGSVYYPATLEGIYQAAQNMSKNHFDGGRCQSIPDEVRERLIHLKRTKSVNVGTGKEYWKKSAENLGICEVDARLFFEKSLPKG